jgi:hypothetical protein
MCVNFIYLSFIMGLNLIFLADFFKSITKA